MAREADARRLECRAGGLNGTASRGLQTGSGGPVRLREPCSSFPPALSLASRPPLHADPEHLSPDRKPAARVQGRHVRNYL